MLRQDGARELKICPFDDYTKCVKIHLGDEEATLTISVEQGGEGINTGKRGAYDLGSLSSYIRITFDTEKGPEQILGYYRIVRELIAILTRQNNVSFDFDLRQMKANKQLFRSAICEGYDGYEDYSTKSNTYVVSIISIADYLPGIIEKLYAHKADALLAVLPESNKDVRRISIANVQDLCTALEVAYDWDDKRAKQRKKKDNTLKELKGKINEVITTFEEEHPELCVNQQTTISQCFQYFNYSLKTRIFILYEEYKGLIDPVLARYGLPPIDEESISKFVKLRDGKTHGGTFEWGDSADIYEPLLALVYVCFFKSVDMTDDMIMKAIRKLF